MAGCQVLAQQANLVPKAIMGGAGFFSKGKIPGNEVGNRPGQGWNVRLMIPSRTNAQRLETIYPDIYKWFKDIPIIRMRTKNSRRLIVQTRLLQGVKEPTLLFEEVRQT